MHDAWWYKAEYNRRLLGPVLARIAAIEGDAEAFTIAGSRDFLAALRAAGITLYVASGTDHPDVVREVQALGLGEFFVEIAGAPVGAMDCSKEAVLRRSGTGCRLERVRSGGDRRWAGGNRPRARSRRHHPRPGHG